jgi:hypothetical protein
MRICGLTNLGVLDQKVRCASNFSFEALAQPEDLKLVVRGHLNKFHLRFGVELKLHRFRRERRFAKTRSAGTGCTLPSIISR